MPLSLTHRPPGSRPSAASGWRPDPFLHFGPDRVYSPLTERTLVERDPAYPLLIALVRGQMQSRDLPEATLRRLIEDGWLLPEDQDPSRRFLLKYVSLEATTLCNQACWFCPVSVSPREDRQMPMDLYRAILDQLAAYAQTIEGVFMISYNEPTADPRFVERVREIRARGLPPAVLTNGTGLTPARVDALVELGGLRFLSINLSTLDRERYRRDRGADHLELVLRNLDYLVNEPVAEEMHIVVLGEDDAVHAESYEAIRRRFAASRFEVKRFTVNDRAGHLPLAKIKKDEGRRLCGCDYFGSRPLQHLHVTPSGTCVLCCQDYDEAYVVGDLNRQTVSEVLAGEELAKLRRWIYGLENAPSDFICRSCSHALTRGE